MQTIRRWRPSRADVLLDALATKADLHVPIPDEGSYAEVLRAFLAATHRPLLACARQPGSAAAATSEPSAGPARAGPAPGAADG